MMPIAVPQVTTSDESALDAEWIEARKCEGCGVRPATNGILCTECAQAEKQARRDGTLENYGE